MLLVIHVRRLLGIQERQEGVVEGEEFVEQVGDSLVSQLDSLQLVREARHAVRASSLEMQQRRYSFVGAHQGRVSRVGVGGGARGHGGVERLVVLQDVALSLCPVDVTPQSINLLLHLGVLTSLPDALEIGFDFAFELQTVAPRAALERFLDDITPQLLRSNCTTN